MMRKIALLACLLFLNSCAPTGSNKPDYMYIPLDNWDGGLLSQEPCGPPCFVGIVPGTTSEATTIGILQQKPEQFQECRTTDEPNTGRRYFCRGLVISVKQDSDIVNGVGFRVAQMITLADVIAKYGEPTAVWVAPDGVPEHPATVMTVFFDAYRIRLDLGPQTGLSFHLKSSLAVDNIVYYSESNDGMRGFIQMWQGYGDYSAKYVEP